MVIENVSLPAGGQYIHQVEDDFDLLSNLAHFYTNNLAAYILLHCNIFCNWLSLFGLCHKMRNFLNDNKLNQFI